MLAGGVLTANSFDAIDTNSDGVIDRNEFSVAMQRLTETLHEQATMMIRPKPNNKQPSVLRESTGLEVSSDTEMNLPNGKGNDTGEAEQHYAGSGLIGAARQAIYHSPQLRTPVRPHSAHGSPEERRYTEASSYQDGQEDDEDQWHMLAYEILTAGI